MAHICLCIVVIACLILRAVVAVCPPVCICDKDHIGRKRVRCETGGIRIPETLSIQSLDRDAEVLIVSGTEQNPNYFNIEPFMFANKRFQEIHLSFSNLQKLPSLPFHYVSDTLQVLNLTHNRLTFVVEGTFRNLSRLTHLHLDHNRIEPVYGAMVNFLPSLRVLTMSNNLIRELPQRMSQSWPTLEVLDLSSNPLGERQPGAPFSEVWQRIPYTVFQDMPNLRVLLLANASLDGLPWQAIQKSVPNLTEIDLSNNQIMTVKANQLSLCTKLQEIRLDGNPVMNIESNAFNGLNLVSLNLSGINSTVLTAGTFQGANITYLDVTYMGLEVLNPKVFDPISQNLEGLNIKGNTELKLELHMFKMLPNLEAIALDMNSTGIPKQFFGYPSGPNRVYFPEYQLVPAAWRCLNPISVTCHIIWPLVPISKKIKI